MLEYDQEGNLPGVRCLEMKTRIAMLFFVCLQCFLIRSVAAQSNWARSFGGGNDDQLRDVQQTSDGGYIAVGVTSSFGSGGDDVWVVKLNSAGSVQFEKVYGGAGADTGSAVRQTADGGYIVAGRTASFGAGGTDFWVLKLDATGAVQFQKAYGGASSDLGFAVAQTSDGGFIVTGQTNSFGANGDVWLLKLDSSLNVQFQKAYGGPNPDRAFAVQQTSDGGYALFGTENGQGATADNFWLLKLDSGGAIQLQKSIGAFGTDQSVGGEQTSDGGYILSGLSASFGATGFDAWVVKLDSSGNIQFQKDLTGTNTEQLRIVQQTPDGGYMLQGMTQSFGAGASDLWLVKLDVSGNVQFQKAYGGLQDESCVGMGLTGDGGAVMVCQTASFGAGLTDGWVVKVGADGSIGSGCLPVTNTAASLTNTNGTVTTTTIAPANTTATVTVTTATATTTFSTASTQCSCPQITVSPATLPDGQTATLYNQVVSSSGGALPITFSVSAGVLPAGLTLDPATGLLSGTPTNVETQNFTVKVTDANGCSGSRDYTIHVTQSCLFCEEFDGASPPSGWDFNKPFLEAGGVLKPTLLNKSTAIATPAFAGCLICGITTSFTTTLSESKIWIYSHRADSKNQVELQISPKKIILKQRVSNTIVKQAVVKTAVAAINTPHTVTLAFDGTNVAVNFDGTDIITGFTPVGTLGPGTIGFSLKKDLGASVDFVHVN